MPKQPAFPGFRHSMKKKQTRREKFLAEMDAVVPWARLLTLIAPHYPKVGPKGGRPPMPLETMLRIYFLQQWYALSDPMAEEMLYDSDAMRQFAGIELGDDRIPYGPKGPWRQWRRVSIRCGQAGIGLHVRSALIRAFASSRSFRRMAMMATLGGFPASRRVVYLALRSGLKRAATSAGM